MYKFNELVVWFYLGIKLLTLKMAGATFVWREGGGGIPHI